MPAYIVHARVNINIKQDFTYIVISLKLQWDGLSYT
jgi:hypothetical protein